MTMIKLNDRDRANVLAGLRLLQETLPHGVSFGLLSILTDAGRMDVPTVQQATLDIDDLCLRIGLGEIHTAEQAA